MPLNEPLQRITKIGNLMTFRSLFQPLSVAEVALKSKTVISCLSFDMCACVSQLEGSIELRECKELRKKVHSYITVEAYIFKILFRIFSQSFD